MAIYQDGKLLSNDAPSFEARPFMAETHSVFAMRVTQVQRIREHEEAFPNLTNATAVIDRVPNSGRWLELYRGASPNHLTRESSRYVRCVKPDGSHVPSERSCGHVKKTRRRRAGAVRLPLVSDRRCNCNRGQTLANTCRFKDRFSATASTMRIIMMRQSRQRLFMS